MKTKYKILAFYSLVFFAWIIFGSNASNPPNGHTNAPFDQFCNNCHGSGSAFNGTMEISGIPSNVEAGETYAVTFTITATQGNPARAGFQLVSVFALNNANAGDFMTSSNDVGTNSTGNREYVEHRGAKNFSGNQASWNFSWVAPSGPDGATITMYYAGNLTNGNGSSSGDRPISGSTSFMLNAESAPLVASIGNQVNVSCNGGNNGTATATATGGTTPYTFVWSNGATTATASNLSAGTYTVTITDGNSMSSTAMTTITQPVVLTTALVGNNIDCQGANNGSATANPAGGTSPYRYLWSNGRTSKTITSLSAGMYTVTVTDDRNCTISGSVTIVAPPALALEMDATDASAPKASDGTATVNATGGTTPYSYSWSNGATTANLGNLPAGSYLVTVTDANQCEAVGMAIIQSMACSLTASISQTPVNCFGDSTGSAIVTVMDAQIPLVYSWSNGQTGVMATDLPAGMYDVTIEDANGCTTILATMVSEPAAIQIEIVTNNPSCPEEADGAIMPSISGGTPPFSFQWSTGFMDTMLSGIVPGLYELTVTDAQGCVSSVLVDLVSTDTVPPVLVGQKITLYLDSTGMLQIPIEIPLVGAIDNCGIDSLWADPASLDCGILGDREVTFMARDAAGNLTEVVIPINVADTIKPVFMTCVEDIEVDSGVMVEYETPQVFDNCGIDSLNLTEGLPSGSIFPPGETKVSYMAVDAAGNYQCCSFFVQVGGTVSAIDEQFSRKIQLFPNPATDWITVQFSDYQEQSVDFFLYSATGQEITRVNRQTWQHGSMAMEIAQLQSGIYFAKIIQDGKIAVRRFLKQ